MNKNEMIELAKQSGWEYAHDESGFEPLWTFAKLVAEKEREACANICEEEPGYKTAFCALKIRARGQVALCITGGVGQKTTGENNLS